MRTTLFQLVGLGLLGVVVACSSDTAKTTDSVANAGTGATGPLGAAAAASTTRAGTGAGTSGSGAATPVPTSPVGSGTAGAGSMACPLLRPVEDTTCTTHSETCIYDEIECVCPAGMWSCSEPVDPNCPAVMPMHGAVCTVPEATECEFLQDECECVGGLWTCESAEVVEDAGVGAPTVPPTPAPDAGTPPPATDPNVPPCPDLRPIEGLSCEVVNRTCLYDTTACQCPMGTWLCNESVDPTCPIEPPIPDSECSGRADCDYFNIECECALGSWSCKAND